MAGATGRQGSRTAPLPSLTVVIVSFNTRELTLKAVSTLLRNAGNVAMDVMVWDNASTDGSADVLERHFPQVRVIRSDTNVGFARAHNLLSPQIASDYMLLLNSDTETLPGAIETLLRFAVAHPTAGAVGGRTLFADGSLNPTSCWNRMTPWSLFCQAVGLTRLAPQSSLFNPEGIGGWQRDSVRHVDIVTGCFLLIRLDVWRALGGFADRYFMYGEDADLCLRLRQEGYRPMVTPAAQIVHHGGQSVARRADKLQQLLRAKASLVTDHWPRGTVSLGIGLLTLWAAVRAAGSRLSGDAERRAMYAELWRTRRQWRAGYACDVPFVPPPA